MRRLGRSLVARPWLVYAVLAALAFPTLEMLVHGERAIQYAHDVFDVDVPRLFSIAADWRANGPVLWNPHLTSGNALFAQFAIPPLAPDVLLSFIVPPFLAYAANTALITFAAGFSMHVLLRDSVRLPALACFAGGIIATFAFWHYIYGYAALLLPLVLWSTDRALSDAHRRRDVLAAILVIAFLLVSSQIQIVLLDGAIALAWVLVTNAAARPVTRPVAGLVVIWTMGALLAAPILATQVVAVPESQRAIWDLAYLYPLGPKLQDFAGLYGGIVFGVPMADGVGGSAHFYGSYFLGAIGLPLLVVGVVSRRRSARERFLLALLVAIPVIDLLALLAVPLQEDIALLRSFQFIRVRHLMPVVLTINAAIGVAWLVGPDPVGRLGARRRALAVVGVAGVGTALAWQVLVALRHMRRPSGTDVVQDGWALGLVALAGGALVVLAIGLVVVLRARRTGWGQVVVTGGLAMVLLLALTGERLVFARSERDLGGNLGTWADHVAPTTAQAFIAAQPGGGRVLSIGEHANRALVAGLDIVDGYQTIYPLRYHELFGALIAPDLALDPERSAYYHGWGNRAYAFGPDLDMDIADLLGVRWLYVRGAPLDDPRLTVRFSDAGVSVYENPGAFPRTFIVHDIEVVADRAAVVSALGSATAEELRSRVYLAAADAPASGARPEGGASNASDAATIETDSIDRIVIEARTTTPGVLVLTDTYSPDWVAEVDGAPSPILAVDGALRGVVIAPGDHRVTFSYRPVATYVGLGLAFLAAALLALWLAVGFARDRARGHVRRGGPDTSLTEQVPPVCI